MNDNLVKHYFREMLNDWLLNVAKRNPSVPMTAVVQNYLYFPDVDSGDVRPRIEVESEQLYDAIKFFQDIPDNLAYEPDVVKSLTINFELPGPKLPVLNLGE